VATRVEGKPSGFVRGLGPWDATMVVAGSMIGSLFLRAIERSERVFASMRSRGYDGHPRPLSRFRMRRADWVVLGASGIALSATLLPVVLV